VDTFFEFYMETGSRKWGKPYLTRAFYSIVGEKMRDRILLVMAKRNGAGSPAPSISSARRPLFGRHWAASRSIASALRVCYYQAIQYAIENKLARVEAGAQGEHKISRGYLRPRPIPRTTSTIRGCAVRSTIFSSASAPMSRPQARSWRKRRRSGRGRAEPQEPYPDEAKRNPGRISKQSRDAIR